MCLLTTRIKSFAHGKVKRIAAEAVKESKLMGAKKTELIFKHAIKIAAALLNRTTLSSLRRGQHGRRRQHRLTRSRLGGFMNASGQHGADHNGKTGYCQPRENFHGIKKSAQFKSTPNHGH
jgi:hypothetical protein